MRFSKNVKKTVEHLILVNSSYSGYAVEWRKKLLKLDYSQFDLVLCETFFARLSEDELEMFVDGEESEVKDAFGSLKGYKEASRFLNYVFNQ